MAAPEGSVSASPSAGLRAVSGACVEYQRISPFPSRLLHVFLSVIPTVSGDDFFAEFQEQGPNLRNAGLILTFPLIFNAGFCTMNLSG
jgi:hypothetical protein